LSLAREYYRILEVTPDHTLGEVKKAFRAKAKKYHPDINRNPGSHDQFIRLTEAYEFIIRQLKVEASNSAHDKHAYENAYYHNFMREWMQQERERIRKQAAREARMNYEKYMNSREFKTTNTLNSIVDYFALFFGLLIIIGAIYGVHQIREAEELNFNRILMGICLFIMGLVIFVFMFSHIFLSDEKK